LGDAEQGGAPAPASASHQNMKIIFTFSPVTEVTEKLKIWQLESQGKKYV
jgi:hypothetical protein